MYRQRKVGGFFFFFTARHSYVCGVNNFQKDRCKLFKGHKMLVLLPLHISPSAVPTPRGLNKCILHSTLRALITLCLHLLIVFYGVLKHETRKANHENWEVKSTVTGMFCNACSVIAGEPPRL